MEYAHIATAKQNINGKDVTVYILENSRNIKVKFCWKTEYKTDTVQEAIFSKKHGAFFSGVGSIRAAYALFGTLENMYETARLLIA